MIIILEGPDGGGKTTLAKKLARQTGFELIHRSKPESEEEKANMKKMYMDLIKSGKNYIFDRCWYSEIVYGTIMRDESVISIYDMYEFERALNENGAIIIYCDAAPGALWARCQERGEDYIIDGNTFVAICRDYERLFNTVPHLVPVTTYVYKGM